MADTAQQQKSLGRLTADMAFDGAMLVRKEIELAKAEMAEKAQAIGLGVAMIAFAACVAMIAFAVLVATSILTLSVWMSPWLAATIVTVSLMLLAATFAGIGVIMIKRGTPLSPENSIAQAKQDVEWLRQQPTSRTTSSS